MSSRALASAVVALLALAGLCALTGVASASSSGGVSPTPYTPDPESGGVARSSGGLSFASVSLAQLPPSRRRLPGSRPAKPVHHGVRGGLGSTATVKAPAPRRRRKSAAPKRTTRHPAPKRPARSRRSRPKPRPPAPAAPAIPPASGPRFPVAGPHSFGNAADRFGAPRSGHVHEGQDILAASGTPVVVPVAGTITVRAYQAAGAGNYLVEHGSDGRDYVFMHLLTGADRVAQGSTVRAGQQISQVGATGDAQGAHLHFEIWPNGWYAKGSHPVDPLPYLRAWDVYS